jgi:hypothetical protein
MRWDVVTNPSALRHPVGTSDGLRVEGPRPSDPFIVNHVSASARKGVEEALK